MVLICQSWTFDNTKWRWPKYCENHWMQLATSQEVWHWSTTSEFTEASAWWDATEKCNFYPHLAYSQLNKHLQMDRKLKCIQDINCRFLSHFPKTNSDHLWFYWELTKVKLNHMHLGKSFCIQTHHHIVVHMSRSECDDEPSVHWKLNWSAGVEMNIHTVLSALQNQSFTWDQNWTRGTYLKGPK